MEKLNLNKEPILNLNKDDNIGGQGVNEKITLDLNKNDEILNSNNLGEKVREVEESKSFYIIEQIPGYRSRKTLNMVVATLWYVFLLFGFTCNWESGDISLILEDAFTVALLLILTLLNANFKGIKDKLPIISSSKKSNRILGLVLYNIGLFTVYGLLLEAFALL